MTGTTPIRVIPNRLAQKKMRLKSIVFAVLSATPFLAGQAMAGNYDVGLTAGSLGVGPQIGWVVVPNSLALRAGFDYLSYSRNVSSDGVNYSGNLKLNNGIFLADYHPFGGAFRMTAGASINNNKASLNATLTTGRTYTSNGVSYTAQPGDHAEANMNFKKIAPYVGIGWGGADLTPGWHFTSDVGVMYLGAPSSTIQVYTANPTAQSLAAQYAQAAQAQLNQDTSKYKWYPVVQLGANYRF